MIDLGITAKSDGHIEEYQTETDRGTERQTAERKRGWHEGNTR
jgi:hypothetical protein